MTCRGDGDLPVYLFQHSQTMHCLVTYPEGNGDRGIDIWQHASSTLGTDLPYQHQLCITIRSKNVSLILIRKKSKGFPFAFLSFGDAFLAPWARLQWFAMICQSGVSAAGQWPVQWQRRSQVGQPGRPRTPYSSIPQLRREMRFQ